MPIVFLRQYMRTVGRVERNVSEEGLLPFSLRVHPFDRLAEEQIGTVARGPLELTVVSQGRVDVRIARRIAPRTRIGLADAAATVDVDFVKTAPFRLILGFIAKMPFAENAGRVAGRFEHLGDGGRL